MSFFFASYECVYDFLDTSFSLPLITFELRHQKSSLHVFCEQQMRREESVGNNKLLELTSRWEIV